MILSANSVHVSQCYGEDENEKMVEPQRVGFWAPKYGEPEKHFNSKLRLRDLLEQQFDVYPEYKLYTYNIENLGERTYTGDMYCEHKTIQAWKFFIEVNGGIHYASHRQKMKTLHRREEITIREEVPVYEFTDEELVGKQKMTDAEIKERLGIAVF